MDNSRMQSGGEKKKGEDGVISLIAKSSAEKIMRSKVLFD